MSKYENNNTQQKPQISNKAHRPHRIYRNNNDNDGHLPMEKKDDFYDKGNHRHNNEEDVIFEKMVDYKSYYTNWQWENRWLSITIDKDGRIAIGCDNKKAINKCGKFHHFKGIRLILSRYYNLNVVKQIPHCPEIAPDNIKSDKMFSFLCEPRTQNKRGIIYFAASNASDFINWAYIIGQCAHNIEPQNIVKEYVENPFIHYDPYDSQNTVIFKRLFKIFKDYKSRSTDNKSYNPTVRKHAIPKIDFNDINLNNFIIFYFTNWVNNMNEKRMKLNEMAQYLSHCFAIHKEDHTLSKGFEEFPKAHLTWSMIHKKHTRFRIRNVPTIYSNAAILSTNIISRYPVYPFPYFYPQTFGYFSSSKIYQIMQCIRKLEQYYIDTNDMCPASIIQCFKRYDMTDQYFLNDTNTRKDFAQLLKDECGVKRGMAIKLWRHFKSN